MSVPRKKYNHVHYIIMEHHKRFPFPKLYIERLFITLQLIPDRTKHS